MKICSAVPLPALKVCSSAMIFLACGFDFFSMIYSIVLLVWLMRLLIRWFLHSCKVPFLGSVMTKDWVHGVGHSPVCQIVVKAVITSSPHAWTSSAGILSTPADFSFFSDCTAASTSFRRMGWSSSVSAKGQFCTDRSPLAL